MPLPNYILAKRHIDPISKLHNAQAHLIINCDNDSFHDSIHILEVCEFMLSHRFQEFLYSFPVNKQLRQQLEQKYMKASLENDAF